MEAARPGDVILLYDMPWLVAHVIDYASGGVPLHHCALVLGHDVWEATIPRCRYVPVSEYQELLSEWASNWRYSVFGGDLLVEVWRWAPLANWQLVALEHEARRWLGVRYSLLRNYLRDAETIHCSEFVSRCLVAAGLLQAEDFRDRRGEVKTPSRRTPVDLRDAIARRGWQPIGACLQLQREIG